MIPTSSKLSQLSLACLTLCLLSACGGNEVAQQSQNAVPAAAPALVATGELQLQSELVSAELDPALQASPHFQVAPVVLPAPPDLDSKGQANSAQYRPAESFYENGAMPVHGKDFALAKLQKAPKYSLPPAPADGSTQTIVPMAGSGTVVTYTPAQIRAAYGLSTVGSTVTGLSAAQAANLGAGQTIYIVDAYHNPNTVAELTAFNQKFGLPTCTTKSASLPLPAASTAGCELIIAYSNGNAGLNSAAPAYNSGWATEIALDVQWAHAIAPMARIVLIEAIDASVNNLTSAVRLANAMGPGVVSMSFGAVEGSWVSSLDSTFTGSKMLYLAATGDYGTQVNWPSVSPNVIAVGGTSLSYSGTGSRTENGWSNTGGGTSAYVATPSYQTSAVPGMGNRGRRAVADVGFNADPNTGQYVATIANGSTTVNWLSGGGTSISAPQWAGIMAIANANLVKNGKSALSSAHSLLYTQIATNASSYASAFADVKSGSNGSCGTCSATTGYDQLVGLGTPNVANLVNLINGGSAPATAPVVNSASVTGKVGTALSFTVSASSANPLTYSLTGAPAGMSINSSGVLSWATPVAGSYSVIVKATDSKTNLSGQGTYSIKIDPATPPVVTAASITGKVGTALSYKLSYTSANAVSFSLTGAPSGLSIASNGTLSWASPVAGNYSVSVTATDTVTKLTGSAKLSISIAAATPPTVTVSNITGKAGVALSANVSTNSTNPVTYGLTGAPSGMTISSTGVISWANPVAGNYSVTVNATDSKTNLTGKATISVTISAATAPVVSPASISGKAGVALSTTVTVSNANPVTYSLTGAPSGMTISTTGVISWANPLAGNYSVTVNALDSKTGLTGKAIISFAIAAATAPVINAATVNGKVGSALSYTVTATSSNPLSYTLTGAPAGMSISSTGVISWASPIAGTYSVTVKATDSKTGLSGQAVLTIVIASNTLSITAPNVSGSVGKAISGNITYSAPGASSISVNLSGVPLGMSFVMSAGNIAYSWASPVAGTYTIKVSAKDNLGRTATVNMVVTIK